MSKSETMLEYSDHSFLVIKLERTNTIQDSFHLEIGHKITIAYLKQEKEIQFFFRTVTLKESEGLKIDILLAGKYQILSEGKINKENLLNYAKPSVFPQLLAITSQLFSSLLPSLSINDIKVPIVDYFNIDPEDIKYIEINSEPS